MIDLLTGGVEAFLVGARIEQFVFRQILAGVEDGKALLQSRDLLFPRFHDVSVGRDVASENYAEGFRCLAFLGREIAFRLDDVEARAIRRE